MCSSCSMLILASCLFNCSSDICWVPSVIRPFFLYICLLHVYICFELIIQQGLWPGTQTGFVSCNNVHFKSLCSCCLQFWFLAVQMTLDIVIVGTALVKRKKKNNSYKLELALVCRGTREAIVLLFSFCCEKPNLKQRARNAGHLLNCSFEHWRKISNWRELRIPSTVQNRIHYIG